MDQNVVPSNITATLPYYILYYIVFENNLELELSLKNWPPLVHASFCPGAVI